MREKLTTVNSTYAHMTVVIVRHLEREGRQSCFHCYEWGNRSGDTEQGDVEGAPWVEVRLSDVTGPRQMHRGCVDTFVDEQRKLIKVDVFDLSAVNAVLTTGVADALTTASAEAAKPLPLSNIPESVRVADRPPDEEREVPASQLVKVAQDVADKGVFTVLPFHESSTHRSGWITRCKVLIWWDKP